MAYLIDSDWLVDLLADVPKALDLLQHLADEGVAMSIVSYMEVYQGVERSDNPREAETRLEALVESMPLLPISPAVARRCARLREALRREGKHANRRALDLLIAATALEHGLTLVTRNVGDYKDIPGINLYAP
jgi:predicted nucleic acid-binding protein